MRGRATGVLKWFSALYVVLIVIQVYLAGEGIFGLNVIKHSEDCDKKGANLAAQHCVGNTNTLDAHRALGFFLTFPGAVLFLIVALVAWHPNMRIRRISILVPILTFVQMILPVRLPLRRASQGSPRGRCGAGGLAERLEPPAQGLG
jgi:hypothetical protein